MANEISNETLINSIEGLPELLGNTVTKVTLNGSEMETAPLSQLGFGDEQGNINVQELLDFLQSQDGSLADEFFGDIHARMEDGHLIIEPRNIGSKG